MKWTQVIEKIVEVMLNGNVAIPIIFELVDTVVDQFRAAFGEGPSLRERADIIERKVNERNDAQLAAEVKRLRIKLGLQQT